MVKYDVTFFSIFFFLFYFTSNKCYCNRVLTFACIFHVVRLKSRCSPLQSNDFLFKLLELHCCCTIRAFVLDCTTLNENFYQMDKTTKSRKKKMTHQNTTNRCQPSKSPRLVLATLVNTILCVRPLLYRASLNCAFSNDGAHKSWSIDSPDYCGR